MSPNERTAAELIAVCLETGSESAWRELVRQFQPLVASVALRIVRQHGEVSNAIVDDLVQETFLRLCRDDSRALRQFEHRHEAAIFSYIKVVTSSVANDYFRALHAQKRSGESRVDPEDALGSAEAAGSSAEHHMLMREIESHLNELVESERDRTVFWLYYRQGFSAQDIANVPDIGLTAKGIESCLLRMIKAIRRKVTPSEDQSGKGLQSPSALGEIR
jgi:RNA polymerase sigma-70 factor (ECF subfamily)